MSKESPHTGTQKLPVRIAVSGVSGFLGGVVARAAHAQGHKVMGWTSEGSVPRFASACARHETWNTSVESLAGHLRAFRPQCIVHCAGSASVASSLQSPYADLQASFGTWSLLLEAVRVSGERPLIIFPSSAAVYGNPSTLPVKEDAPLLPISPYGTHKKLCEELAASYHRHFGIPVVVLRLFSVFGPSQRRLLVHELFERCSSSADHLMIAGTGAETRDFLSEWCVSDAILSVARLHGDSGNLPALPRILNLASGEEHSVFDVATRLRDLVCPERPITCLGQELTGNPSRWHADTSALRRLIPHWQPLPIQIAMERTVAEWRLLREQSSAA